MRKAQCWLASLLKAKGTYSDCGSGGVPGERGPFMSYSRRCDANAASDSSLPSYGLAYSPFVSSFQAVRPAVVRSTLICARVAKRYWLGNTRLTDASRHCEM